MTNAAVAAQPAMACNKLGLRASTSPGSPLLPSRMICWYLKSGGKHIVEGIHFRPGCCHPVAMSCEGGLREKQAGRHVYGIAGYTSSPASCSTRCRWSDRRLGAAGRYRESRDACRCPGARGGICRRPCRSLRLTGALHGGGPGAEPPAKDIAGRQASRPGRIGSDGVGVATQAWRNGDPLHTRARRRAGSFRSGHQHQDVGHQDRRSYKACSGNRRFPSLPDDA